MNQLINSVSSVNIQDFVYVIIKGVDEVIMDN